MEPSDQQRGNDHEQQVRRQQSINLPALFALRPGAFHRLRFGILGECVPAFKRVGCGRISLSDLVVLGCTVSRRVARFICVDVFSPHAQVICRRHDRPLKLLLSEREYQTLAMR
jgi:hypothetical protein